MTTPEQPQWRKSSYSAHDGECVQVAVGAVVRVRDSKNPAGGTLTMSLGQWETLIAAVKADRPKA